MQKTFLIFLQVVLSGWLEPVSLMEERTEFDPTFLRIPFYLL